MNWLPAHNLPESTYTFSKIENYGNCRLCSFVQLISFLLYICVHSTVTVTLPCEVPWLDEYPDGVEWVFDKARPEVASRMVHKMDGAEVVKTSEENSTAPRPNAKAKAKSRSSGTICGIDSFRLCSEECVILNTSKSKRVKTFIDVVMGSALYVTSLIDRDFSSAVTNNLILGLHRLHNFHHFV